MIGKPQALESQNGTAQFYDGGSRHPKISDVIAIPGQTQKLRPMCSLDEANELTDSGGF